MNYLIVKACINLADVFVSLSRCLTKASDWLLDVAKRRLFKDNL